MWFKEQQVFLYVILFNILVWTKKIWIQFKICYCFKSKQRDEIKGNTYINPFSYANVINQHTHTHARTHVRAHAHTHTHTYIYMTSQKSNSNSVWFNFQTYIIFSINLVSQVTLRSRGTDIENGCHLLRCLCNILYFLWLYDEFFIILYNILKIAELDCCQIIILSTDKCIIYTRLDTCLMSISTFSLRDKVALRLLKLHFYGTDVVEWSRALDMRLSDWCFSVSMVWVQIPSREEQKFDSSNI
jgi:hypothetical protein